MVGPRVFIVRLGLAAASHHQIKSNMNTTTPTTVDTVSQLVADKQGNKLKIMNSGNVWLKLLAEPHERKLGFIDRERRQFVVHRKRAEHLHRKSNSYGFNHHMLSKAIAFDTVLLEDEYGRYAVPIAKILTHGAMHFKEQGFELQIFVALEIIEIFKISSFEQKDVNK